MPMASCFDEYENYANSLEQIAANLDARGLQHVALERAGWALAFVTMYHHQEFEDFLRQKDKGELTAEQRAWLKKCGLD